MPSKQTKMLSPKKTQPYNDQSKQQNVKEKATDWFEKLRALTTTGSSFFGSEPEKPLESSNLKKKVSKTENAADVDKEFWMPDEVKNKSGFKQSKIGTRTTNRNVVSVMNVKSRFRLLRGDITVGYVVKSFAQNVPLTVSDSQTIVVITFHMKFTPPVLNNTKNPKKKKKSGSCVFFLLSCRT